VRKKSWRWVLGSIACLGALLALFVWDAIRRAEAAIDAHERQVALDIAALRASHARWISQAKEFSFPSTDRSQLIFQEARELVTSGKFYPYESGPSATDSVWYFLLLGDEDFDRAGFLPKLAGAQELLRGGGFQRASARCNWEGWVLAHWMETLKHGRLSPRELERSARGLVLLESSRTPVREALEGERVMLSRRVPGDKEVWDLNAKEIGPGDPRNR